MAAETPFVNHLQRWEDDDLRVAAKHVADLLDSPGWKALTLLLDEVHGTATSHLLLSHAGARGEVMEQAEYARLVGFLSGLTQPQIAAGAFHTAAERVARKNAEGEHE